MKTLREINPSAADEWYYPMNGDMTPDNVAGKSAKWAYFQCPKKSKAYISSTDFLNFG